MKVILFIVTLLYCSISQAQSINWERFDKKTFIKATEENKYVLLNIGASWCHWCHVMDDSTYSNSKIITLLSESYVACKENQDNRPDLFSKYRDYGWPAIILFDKNAKEVAKLSGYYSPKEFEEILKNVLSGDYKETSSLVPNNKLNDWNDSIEKFIKNDFYSFLDNEKGGFLMSQKYIDYDGFEYALRNYKKDKALELWLHKTVNNSYFINDTQWGGVYQYSTGRDWRYAHFEKLLSIQARYLKMYAMYYAVFKTPKTLSAINGITKYINAFLKTPTALFYNSQDADLKSGEHAGEYFKLTSAERLKKGIPKIDSTAYARENAQLAEAFVYLWVATKNKRFLLKAESIMAELKQFYFNQNTGYSHTTNNSLTESTLSDNISVAKALFVLYNATGKTEYKNQLTLVCDLMIKNFKSLTAGFYNYKSESNPLEPSKVLSENIELARLLNRSSYMTQHKNYEEESKQIMKYIISDEVLKSIIAESGILTLKAELDKEPTKIVAILNEKDTEWHKALNKTWDFNNDYFIIEKQSTIISSKDDEYFDMKEVANGSPCVFSCTSKQCSSPIFSVAELQIQLKKILNKK